MNWLKRLLQKWRTKRIPRNYARMIERYSRTRMVEPRSTEG